MVSISESPSSLLLAPLALPSKSDMNRWFVKGSGVDQMRQQATKDERIAEELGSKIHNEMSLLAGKADGSSSSIIARAELAATKVDHPALPLLVADVSTGCNSGGSPTDSVKVERKDAR
eukprot:747226-Hanusia_phi.AAC.4